MKDCEKFEKREAAYRSVRRMVESGIVNVRTGDMIYALERVAGELRDIALGRMMAETNACDHLREYSLDVHGSVIKNDAASGN